MKTDFTPSPLESSDAFFSLITKPVGWVDNMKDFMATNPVVQGVIQAISRIC